MGKAIAPVVLVLSCGLAAQAAPPAYLRPVDQAVEDLDPLARSTRILQPGLVSYGQDVRLFTPVIPGDPHRLLSLDAPTYYRFDRGFMLRLDKMNYAVPTPRGARLNVASSQDGVYREIMPNNAVFMLDRIPEPIAPPAAINPHRIRHDPINYRLDAKLRGRLDGRIAAED